MIPGKVIFSTVKIDTIRETNDKYRYITAIANDYESIN